MHPFEQVPSVSDDVKAVPKQSETNEQSKIHTLATLPEAPLIQKKVLVTHQVTIYPTREAMFDKNGGRVSRAVPALFYVIDSKQDAIDQAIGLQGYNVGNSKGENIGWISTKECKEWSLPTAWSPNVQVFKDPPLLYSSLKTDSDSSKKTEGVDGALMPKELYDSELVFPVLENRNGFYRIDRPLPSTVESNLTFPLWVEHRYRSEEKADGSTESLRDSNFLLLEERKFDDALRNFNYLVPQWQKLDPYERKESVALLAATQNAYASIVGNIFSPQQLTRDAMSKTAKHTDSYILDWTIDDIAIMDDGEFADFLKWPLLETLDNLKKAEQGEKYSLRVGQTVTKFVRVPWEGISTDR